MKLYEVSYLSSSSFPNILKVNVVAEDLDSASLKFQRRIDGIDEILIEIVSISRLYKSR